MLLLVCSIVALFRENYSAYMIYSALFLHYPCTVMKQKQLSVPSKDFPTLSPAMLQSYKLGRTAVSLLQTPSVEFAVSCFILVRACFLFQACALFPVSG